MSDPFTAIYKIVDQDGKEQRVYPMKLKDKDIVPPLIEKFTSDNVFANFMLPKFNKEDSSIERGENGEILYDNEPYQNLMKLLCLATRQTEEQILEWVDVTTARQIVEIFLDISQLQQKKTMI